MKAEKKRSNKILLDAIKKFGAICDEEKYLVSVRNAACQRALERSQFLGRNTLALGFAQRLANINPDRNYEYLKKLGVAYLMLGKGFKNSDPDMCPSQAHIILVRKSPPCSFCQNMFIKSLQKGRNVEAEATFKSILDIDEFDGWANVHMGFAVKAQDRVRFNDWLTNHFILIS